MEKIINKIFASIIFVRKLGRKPIQSVGVRKETIATYMKEKAIPTLNSNDISFSFSTLLDNYCSTISRR